MYCCQGTKLLTASQLFTHNCQRIFKIKSARLIAHFNVQSTWRITLHSTFIFCKMVLNIFIILMLYFQLSLWYLRQGILQKIIQLIICWPLLKAKRVLQTVALITLPLHSFVVLRSWAKLCDVGYTKKSRQRRFLVVVNGISMVGKLAFTDQFLCVNYFRVFCPFLWADFYIWFNIYATKSFSVQFCCGRQGWQMPTSTDYDVCRRDADLFLRQPPGVG